MSCLGAVHLLYYCETGIHYVAPTGLGLTEIHLLCLLCAEIKCVALHSALPFWIWDSLTTESGACQWTRLTNQEAQRILLLRPSNKSSAFPALGLQVHQCTWFLMRLRETEFRSLCQHSQHYTAPGCVNFQMFRLWNFLWKYSFTKRTTTHNISYFFFFLVNDLLWFKRLSLFLFIIYLKEAPENFH